MKKIFTLLSLLTLKKFNFIIFASVCSVVVMGLLSTGIGHADNGHTASGTVTYGSAALTGATVELDGIDNTARSTITDQAGHYSIANIPDGSYKIRIFRYYVGDGTSSPTVLNLNGSASTITSALTINGYDVAQNFDFKAARISAIVKDGNGQPIGGAKVTLRSTDDNGIIKDATGTFEFQVANSYITSENVSTDNNGVALLAAIPGTTYRVCAVLSGGSSNCVNDIAVSSDLSVNIDLPVSYTVSGQLSFGSLPLANATFELDNPTGAAGSATTDANGNYTISQIPDGTYKVRIYNYFSGNGITSPTTLNLNGDASGITSALTVSGRDVQQNFAFEAAPVTAQIKDGSGQPAPNATLRLWSIDDNGTVSDETGLFTFQAANNYIASENVTTDVNGMATLAAIPGTKYRLCATLSDGTIQCSEDTAVSAATTIALAFPASVDPATSLTAGSPTSTPTLTWTASKNATSYTVYRNNAIVGTTVDTDFTDSNAVEGVNNYYVTASNGTAYSVASNTVSVLVDKTPPTIKYSITPAANSDNWNNSTVTVTFNCTDSLTGIASCTSPQTLTTDGANQTVQGVATDKAGNTSSTIATINIDATAPSISNASWSANPISAGSTTSWSSTVADSGSGIKKTEYYVGTDPGTGNGLPVTVVAGNASVTLGNNLAAGVYAVGMRTMDTAGNWSTTTTSMLTVYDPSSTLRVTGKNKKDLIPKLANGDILPGLVNATQTDAADYGFTVEYKNGAIDPRSDLMFNYSTGTNCGKATAQGCHQFSVNATGFNWLIINQANNSHASFQGNATVSVDGLTSTNPFSVEAVDGNLTNPTGDDTILLKVYAPGANPDTSTPLYQASGAMTKGNSINIQ